MSWDEAFDVVIVGSGGGSVVSALRARELGLTALIVEKQATFGGSTCFSGGVLWIPNNPVTQTKDDADAGRRYMDALISDAPGSSPQRRTAFIREAPLMISFLMKYGMKFIDAHWPDYYGHAPGSTVGRSLVCPMFNDKRLGKSASKLNLNRAFPILPIRGDEVSPLSTAKQNWKGRFYALRIAARLAYQKLTGHRLLGTGAAIQGQTFEIALREKLPMWLNAPLTELISEDGVVTGVTVNREGRAVRVQARKGVILNTGGFSRNLEMRERFQPKPASVNWTVANPGDTGEAIEMAMGLGAAVEQMNEAWWTPGSVLPDGKMAGFHIPGDAAKPHCIVVNAAGKRFGDESGSYMEFGQRMYANDAVPAWAIIESRHRARYAWGFNIPGHTPKVLVENGYFKMADTIQGLAQQCGVSTQGLVETVERFNGFCAEGVDKDFRRGSTPYNAYQGDISVKPNPCLGPIEKPPFYAVAIYPADVGTAGGVMTDENARVLRGDGSAIEGLYATGNTTASVMGRVYPGAGASIAAAFTFGYIAVKDAAERKRGASAAAQAAQ